MKYCAYALAGIIIILYVASLHHLFSPIAQGGAVDRATGSTGPNDVMPCNGAWDRWWRSGETNDMLIYYACCVGDEDEYAASSVVIVYGCGADPEAHTVCWEPTLGPPADPSSCMTQVAIKIDECRQCVYDQGLASQDQCRDGAAEAVANCERYWPLGEGKRRYVQRQTWARYTADGWYVGCVVDGDSWLNPNNIADGRISEETCELMADYY